MHRPPTYTFGQILDIFWPYILLIGVAVALISFWLFASHPKSAGRHVILATKFQAYNAKERQA